MSDLINRDDAIRELNGACSNWEDDAKVQEIVMAISSAKPTCDLISRADALAFPIRINHYDREHGDLHFVLGIETVMEYIENLPSAELVLQTPQTYGKSINPSNAEVVADYISRADAIEAVAQQWLFETSAESPYVNDDDIDDYRKLVEELLSDIPSAEDVQGWIPCSERLPKRDELVLVTYKTTNRIHLCRYTDDGSENPWWSYIDDCCAWNNVVLAWMPLPKPYREEREVEE